MIDNLYDDMLSYIIELSMSGFTMKHLRLTCRKLRHFIDHVIDWKRVFTLNKWVLPEESDRSDIMRLFMRNSDPRPIGRSYPLWPHFLDIINMDRPPEIKIYDNGMIVLRKNPSCRQTALDDPDKTYLCDDYLLTSDSIPHVKYLVSHHGITPIECYTVIPGTYGRFAVVTERKCKVFDVNKNAYVLDITINSSTVACSPIIPIIIWSKNYLFLNKQRWTENIYVYTFSGNPSEDPTGHGPRFVKMVNVGAFKGCSFYVSRCENYIIAANSTDVALYDWKLCKIVRTYSIITRVLLNKGGMILSKKCSHDEGLINIYDEIYGYLIGTVYTDKKIYETNDSVNFVYKKFDEYRIHKSL